jgi:hypothetical protein
VAANQLNGEKLQKGLIAGAGAPGSAAPSAQHAPNEGAYVFAVEDGVHGSSRYGQGEGD